MNISEPFIRRPVATTLLTIGVLLVLTGLGALLLAGLALLAVAGGLLSPRTRERSPASP